MNLGQLVQVGYDPDTIDNSNPGEIPDVVQMIESIAEAYHDFIHDTTRSSVTIRIHMKDFFARILNISSGLSEEVASDKIHEMFNGQLPLKADLRLDAGKRDKPYENPEILADALFFSPDRPGRSILANNTDISEFQVKPLVFMIPTYLLENGSFDNLLYKLANLLQGKYMLQGVSAGNPDNREVKLGITHDAYKHEGMKVGNIFNGHIILSPATLYDPATTGSGEEYIKSAISENRFNRELNIAGNSYWGTWEMLSHNIGPNIATINLSIGGNNISLGIPKHFYRGPSPANLSMIYDTLMSYFKTGRKITDAQKNFILGEIFAKNPGKGAFNKVFYSTIIDNCIDLYVKSPYLLLRFIFFLKELGDMMQHKAAISLKHLALGSVDGLSTIAFLKRGGPVSYIVKSIKGLPNLLFRVAGTFHKTGGMTAEQITEQNRVVEAARAAAEERARLAKAALKIERDSLKAAKAADEKKMYSKFELIRQAAIEEALKKAEREARKASKASKPPKNSISLLKFRKINGLWNLIPRGGASTSVSSRRNKKRKQIGGSKWRKTFKQKGGADIDIDEAVVLLINALFMNLYDVLDNNREDTMLFTDPHPYTHESINDYTLMGKFPTDEKVFFDNNLLGLPLSSVLYMLYDVIDEANNKADKTTIIAQFLEVYNFTPSDIGRISHYMDPLYISESVAAEPEEELTRPLTQSDKVGLRILVDKGYDIPGIIPTVYYEKRGRVIEGFEEPVTEEEEIETQAESAAEVVERAVELAMTVAARAAEAAEAASRAATAIEEVKAEGGGRAREAAERAKNAVREIGMAVEAAMEAREAREAKIAVNNRLEAAEAVRLAAEAGEVVAIQAMEAARVAIREQQILVESIKRSRPEASNNEGSNNEGSNNEGNNEVGSMEGNMESSNDESVAGSVRTLSIKPLKRTKTLKQRRQRKSRRNTTWKK